MAEPLTPDSPPVDDPVYGDATVTVDQVTDSVVFGGVNLPSVLWTPSPADLSGWWDAGTLGLDDGDPVNVWPDLSPSGADLDPTSHEKPRFESEWIGGQPAVRFAPGVVDGMASNTSIDVRHIFVVSQFDGATWPGRVGLFVGRPTLNILLSNGSGDRFYNVFGPYWMTGNEDATNAGPMNTPGIVETAPPPANVDPVVGRHATQGNWGWAGPIAEILVYPAALSTEDRQKTEGYLAHKYGLETDLPVAHPYRAGPPVSPPVYEGAGVALDLEQVGVSLEGESTPGTVFTPMALAPSGWWDASQLAALSDGDHPAIWPDVSGNEADVTQHSAPGPTYRTNGINSIPTVEFNNAAKDAFSETTNSVTVHEFYAVVQFDGTNFGPSNHNSVAALRPGDAKLRVLGMRPSTKFFAIGPEVQYLRDGTPMGANNREAPMNEPGLIEYVLDEPTTGKFMVSLDLNTVTRSWNGFISEILLYPTALTEAERHMVEGYLAHKYGIQAKLPVAHPYRNGPPGDNPVHEDATVGLNDSGHNLAFDDPDAELKVDA